MINTVRNFITDNNKRRLDTSNMKGIFSRAGISDLSSLPSRAVKEAAFPRSDMIKQTMPHEAESSYYHNYPQPIT